MGPPLTFALFNSLCLASILLSDDSGCNVSVMLLCLLCSCMFVEWARGSGDLVSSAVFVCYIDCLICLS